MDMVIKLKEEQMTEQTEVQRTTIPPEFTMPSIKRIEVKGPEGTMYLNSILDSVKIKVGNGILEIELNYEVPEENEES